MRISMVLGLMGLRFFLVYRIMYVGLFLVFSQLLAMDVTLQERKSVDESTMFKELPSWYHYLSPTEKNIQLIKAVMKGDLQSAKTLVALGADPQVFANQQIQLIPSFRFSKSIPVGYNPDYYGMFVHPRERESLLELAVMKGYKDIIGFLIDEGVSIDGILSLTAALCTLDTAAYLVSRGAQVNGTRKEVCKGKDGPVMKESLVPLLSAFMNCNEPLFTFLQASGANVPPPIEVGVDLHIAAGSGDISRVRALLKNDADVHKEVCYTTPIDWAATNGHPHVVSLLLQRGAQITYRAIASAVWSGNPQCVELLIDAGKIGKDLWRYYCALAAAWGKKKVIMLFLQKGYAINTRFHYGDTLLGIAALHDQEKVVEFLLENKVKLNDSLLSSSRISGTPLHRALSVCSRNIVTLLLKKGLTVLAWGLTDPYMLFGALNGDSEMVEIMLEAGDLREHGLNVNFRGPLHAAASYDYASVLSVLLDQGMTINKPAHTTHDGISKMPEHKPLNHEEEFGPLKAQCLRKYYEGQGDYYAPLPPLLFAAYLSQVSACKVLLSYPFFECFFKELIEAKKEASGAVWTFFLLFKRLKKENGDPLVVPKDVQLLILSYDMKRLYHLLALLFRPAKGTIMRPVTQEGHYYTANLMRLRSALAGVTKAPTSIKTWIVIMLKNAATTIHRCMLRRQYEQYPLGPDMALDPEIRRLLDIATYEENFDILLEGSIRHKLAGIM